MAVGGFDDFTISMWRGDDRTISIAVFESDGVTPQDITGWDLWVTGKTDIDDLDVAAVFQLEIGAGITVTDAAGGLATAQITNAMTQALPDATTTLYVDVQAKDAGGDIATLSAGTIRVYQDLTLAIS